MTQEELAAKIGVPRVLFVTLKTEKVTWVLPHWKK